jgi:hypothetical protein
MEVESLSYHAFTSYNSLSGFPLTSPVHPIPSTNAPGIPRKP